MKNKGFTLVEIMAVLVIMGILLLVTVPSIFNSIDKKKKREHEKIINEIKNAAELYVTQNEDVMNFLNSTGNIGISYSTLVTESLIDGNQLDPLTSKPWNSNTYVNIKKEGKSMVSEYIEGLKVPDIYINASDIEISSRENYFVNKLLEQVTVTDETGIDYKSAIIYTCKINKTGTATKENCKNMKNMPGTHQIIYTLIVSDRTYSKAANVTIN